MKIGRERDKSLFLKENDMVHICQSDGFNNKGFPRTDSTAACTT